MCFGRLTGAATGLEVSRGGAREWVEGQTDRQAPASETSSKLKKEKKKEVFQGAKLFFHLERK